MTGTSDSVHVAHLLPAYVAGTLDAVGRGRVFAHLADCPACRAELAAWHVIQRATREVYGETGLADDEALHQVWHRIDGATNHDRPLRLATTNVTLPASEVSPPQGERQFLPLPRLHRPSAHVATAALLLLTLIGSFLTFGPGRPGRQHEAPRHLPATNGNSETVTTERLLEATTDALPAGHAIIGVRGWTLRPSPKPLIMPPLGGPMIITVTAGTIEATVDGEEQRITEGQHLALSGDQGATFRAAGPEEARAFDVYVVSSFTTAGRALGETSVDGSTWAYDPVVYTFEYLITASPDALPSGPSHFILERLILPPGSILPPQEASPLTWIEVGKGVLGLTLEGEQLPFRWTSGDERSFRPGQKLPATQPGTTMTLRNAGDAPLVLYRLMLIPSAATPQPP